MGGPRDLLIKIIKEGGLLDAWNRQQVSDANCRVQVGDRIIEVNGVSGVRSGVRAMVRELRSHKKVDIQLRREINICLKREASEPLRTPGPPPPQMMLPLPPQQQMQQQAAMPAALPAVGFGPQRTLAHR